MKEFSFLTFPILKTERLTLRALTFDDVESIFELRSSKEVNKLITRKTPKNLEDAKEFISVCHQEFTNKNRIFWAIEFNKKIIGTIVLYRISSETEYAEIGYELFPTYHQKGFMSEAMTAVLKFEAEHLKLKTIEAFTHKNNMASRSLLEKHHFVFQPTRREKGFENNRIFKLEVESLKRIS
ncbi:MAG: GNAT family N-acetyltransferase [Polaribacter sp.]